MREEDDPQKEKIEELEDTLEELKKETGETEPDKLQLYIYYEDEPEAEDLALIFLDPAEYKHYFLKNYSIPQFEMNEYQSPTRQAIRKFKNLGFDAYEDVSLIGRTIDDWKDYTEYQFKVKVRKEQAKFGSGNWVKENELDNYTDAKTYIL